MTTSKQNNEKCLAPYLARLSFFSAIYRCPPGALLTPIPITLLPHFQRCAARPPRCPLHAHPTTQGAAVAHQCPQDASPGVRCRQPEQPPAEQEFFNLEYLPRRWSVPSLSYVFCMQMCQNGCVGSNRVLRNGNFYF